MNCACGNPVDQAIEGEIVCPDCRSLADMTPEDLKAEKDRQHMQTHCCVCSQKTSQSVLERNGGWCDDCNYDPEEEYRN